jgi:hypothetical protein
MFISKAEKASIEARIAQLTALVLKHDVDLQQLLAPKTKLVEVKPKKGRNWTPEQRAAASERMKNNHLRKKV